MRCEGHAAPCSCAHRHCCCCWAAALARCPSETPSRRGCRGNPLALQARCPGSAVQYEMAACSWCSRGKQRTPPLRFFFGRTHHCTRTRHAGTLQGKASKAVVCLQFWQPGRWHAVAAWQMARFVIRCGASPLTPARGSPAACCAAAAACCAASAAPAPAGPANVRVWVWVWVWVWVRVWVWVLGPVLGLGLGFRAGARAKGQGWG